jgi:hypothetical protein
MEVKVMINDVDKVYKHQFLYPIHSYHQQNPSHSSIFNAKLQEFSTKVGFVSSLHTNGKLSSQQVCEQLQQLWKMLDN